MHSAAIQSKFSMAARDMTVRAKALVASAWQQTPVPYGIKTGSVERPANRRIAFSGSDGSAGRA